MQRRRLPCQGTLSRAAYRSDRRVQGCNQAAERSDPLTAALSNSPKAQAGVLAQPAHSGLRRGVVLDLIACGRDILARAMGRVTAGDAHDE